MSMPSTAPRRLRIASTLVVAAAAGALLAGNAVTAEAAAPEVISRWNNELIHVNSISPSFNQAIFSGPYTVTTKLTAENTGSTAILYTCLVSAEGGADTDHAFVTLPPNSQQTVALNVVHNFTGNGVFTFACTKPAGTPTVRMKQIKITGLKVNSVHNAPF
ncbi:hypothetical protein ACQEUU_18870 [Nonomuraea sp. CA-218870]|uniref:hypothetical protein n=1 Tax=Nonomuraea sp. CA-218870 TaxID=3239998 RepID=UPI003D8CBB6A